SIKKTRSQSQKEIDELIEHVSEKTYAYGTIRAENQNLLSTISELKTRLKTVKKVSKPVTLQTSPDKQRRANSNKNVITPGMYKVVTTQESQTNEAKSGLSSTGMNAATSVRRPMNKDSHVKKSVLANSKNLAKKVPIYVRKNKQTDKTYANVISKKENVRIKQKLQENGQNRTNTDTRNERAHKKPRIQKQKGKKSTLGQDKTSLKLLIGQYPSKVTTWIVKKAKGMKQFTLNSLTEEAH
ncbi:hypothetical protein Tco_1521983, partial [Tanacetum coccineum]